MSGRERQSILHGVQHAHFSRRNTYVGGLAIAAGAMAMALVAAVVAHGYQRIAYGWAASVWREAALGALAGLFYAVPFLVRSEYTIPAYLAQGRRLPRIVMAWNGAMLGLLALAFLTQTSDVASRGAAVLFYFAGLIVMLALEQGVRAAVIGGLGKGTLERRRVMLVGRAHETRAFMARLDRTGGEADRIGIRVVAVTTLPEAAVGRQGLTLADALERAVAKARSLLPDDVVIVAPHDDADTVGAAAAAFETLPVAIHLDAGTVLARFRDMRIASVGGAATFSLAEVPLSPLQEACKRAFDLAAAGVGLLLALPLFAAIALAIKVDSPGPVFFRQDRFGFNRQRFRIWKFRTMRVDAAAKFEQARKSDPRITRVGRLLRRTSLDELPQLLNVLAGEMSLVGPRPHAVEHDAAFERRLERYPRRLNMKPGITGWAQVNGLRGETDTDDKMQRRLEADLYYIDNWSLLFDTYIVLLTVVSPKVFRHAR